MATEGAELVSYAEALECVLSHAEPLGVEQCALNALLGRVTAEPVTSLADMPRFDTSAMDGYGIHADDVARLQAGPVHLPLVGTAAAGWDPASLAVQPGQAIRILTGAAVPTGVAAVVMQEDVVVEGGVVSFTRPVKMGQHIRLRGEEYAAGDVVVPAGIVAAPGVVAATAAAGHASVTVHGRPRVGLLITGEELTAPGEALGPGHIYESNSYGLSAALAAMGFPPPTVVRTPDRVAETRAGLAGLLDRCDVVITSGGVSVGEFDIVKDELCALEVETLVWGVAIKPGKPFYFGRAGQANGSRRVFGLPGNPVAAMVTFHMLVRPYLLAVQGLEGRPQFAEAQLAAPLRKKAGRMEFVPCRVSNGMANPVVKRGSHMPGGLVGVNSLLLFPRAKDALAEGESVLVTPLAGGLV